MMRQSSGTLLMMLAMLAVNPVLGAASIRTAAAAAVAASAIRTNEDESVTVNDADLSQALLEKAVRLPSSNSKQQQLQQQQAPAFMNLFRSRSLEDGGGGESEEDNGDDYYISDDSLRSFSGFSLKYAKCQTIQRFSEDAIKNGEYSAMVKDDIVILRLCPTNQCNSNKQYGCHYNYAEYAIGVSDYVKVMLKYTIDQKEKMCDFCAACSGNGRKAKKNRRKLEEEGDQGDQQDEDQDDQESGEGDEDEQSQDEGEDEQQDDGADEEEEEAAAEEQFDDDDYYKEDDDGGGGGNNNAADDDYVDPCDTYVDECDAVYNSCNGGADDDVGYLDYVDYFDYLDCVKVEGQEGQDNYYWTRPRCDAKKGTIHMDIYYDPYCSQYAGGDVNLREFSGIYFRTSVFEPFYAGTCHDCSESNAGPYYNANSNLCNRLYTGTAKCTKNMMYELFDDDDDATSSSSSTTTECSFIESVRSGTYNEKGEIYVDSSLYGDKVKMEVTSAQTAGLVISIFTCVALGIYSCYLHHSITNLLIKSLSHSHLLPPSRHRTRGKSSSSNSSRNRNRRGNNEDDDWDHSVGVAA